MVCMDRALLTITEQITVYVPCCDLLNKQSFCFIFETNIPVEVTRMRLLINVLSIKLL